MHNHAMAHRLGGPPDLVAYYATIATARTSCIRPSGGSCPGSPRTRRRCSTSAAVRVGLPRSGAPDGPRSRYTGVDISAPLVQRRAKPTLSTSSSRPTAPTGVPLDDRYADVVSALGWLHWEQRYARALAELWRLSGRYAFFDLRLVDGHGADVTGTAAPRPDSRLGRAHHRSVHLCVLATSGAVAAEARPGRILAHGYWGRQPLL